MFRKPVFALLTALLCMAALAAPANAAEVDCTEIYCFSAADFGEDLAGICLTELPDSRTGTVMLGTRVLQPGDILTADQLSQMTFAPLHTARDSTAQLGYLPILSTSVEPETAMTLAIRGREDKAPVAEDSAWETYKDLPNTGKLRASDPEGQSLAFTVVRQPRRGKLTLNEDGTFTYAPKKNKVGVDSFTYTATDPAGNVSREATVTVTILKPTDAPQYTDTANLDCRFAAEWMKHTGIFTGEQLAGEPCFHPDKEVTRGEFVTMLVKALDIPTQETLTATGYTDDVPGWLQPYLAAAVRSGLTAGLPEQDVFGAAEPITGAEAAVMLQNALDLSAAAESGMEEDAAIPVWAQPALSAVRSGGIRLEADVRVTRGAAAQALYQAAQLSHTSVFTQ